MSLADELRRELDAAGIDPPRTWVLVRFVEATPEFWTGCSWSREYPDVEIWNETERYDLAALDLIDHLTDRDGGEIAFLDTTERS